MRQIDADALIERTRAHGQRIAYVESFIQDIKEAPTVATDTNVLSNGWISVKDRLPENDNEVITAYKIDDEKVMKKRKGKLFVKTGNWTGYRWISVWDEYKSFATEETVLYWRPMPEAPKEEA